MHQLPDWLPVEAWEGFVEMRKQIKKPLKTERAISLAINTLDKLRAEGQNVAAVLDQSTMNSWLGLFPITERRADPSKTNRSNFPALGKHGQATANNLQDWLEDYGNGR
jgi:hypothetical protein